MFKDGVMEVSKDNEIAYSEVAKVSPRNIFFKVWRPHVTLFSYHTILYDDAGVYGIGGIIRITSHTVVVMRMGQAGFKHGTGGEG